MKNIRGNPQIKESEILRRDIVHIGAGQLRYEIREIVETAHELEKLGIKIIWENIGDPIQKGESVPDWIKNIVIDLACQDISYAYTGSAGEKSTQAFLAEQVNRRGCVQVKPSDIIFFNGLGDAVTILFAYLRREARILGPSPAYSTLSSSEAAHSGYDHLTYELDPDNGWEPNLKDMDLKVTYNDSIAGILLINPDNPTGAVYSREILEQIVDIARKHNIFLLADETYANIVYPGVKTASLSEVIGDVPGIALRSISKEIPWPGARCGWAEVYNQDKNRIFRRYISSLVDAKRLEVCSTTLPQKSIPRIFSDSRYPGHLEQRAKTFAQRAQEAVDILGKVSGITVIKPAGAFYLTTVFNTPLPSSGPLPKMLNEAVERRVTEISTNVAPDKRFVYWLLGATGICTVPLSGFCSSLMGFRTTLLEQNNEKRIQTYKTIAKAIETYLNQN